MTSFRRPFRFALLLSGLGGSLLGCGGDTTGPPQQDISQAFWAIRVNQSAINLAITPSNNTFQLVATPLNSAGTPLSDVGVTTFRTTDSSVTVSPSGLVQAHNPTNAAPVLVTITAQGVTLTDTVLVQVTSTPPTAVVATFSLQPAPGDSAKRAIDYNAGSFSWTVTATDAAQQTICSGNQCPLLVAYTSSNSLVARINKITGAVFVVDTGRVVFKATTWAYGKAWQDSVIFTIGFNLTGTNRMTLVSAQSGSTVAFSFPSKVVLGVGAVVVFENGTPHPVGIVFDDTTGIDTASATLYGNIGLPTGRGNIAAFGGIADTSTADSLLIKFLRTPYILIQDASARQFTVPGIYRYHSTAVPSDTFELEIRSQHSS